VASYRAFSHRRLFVHPQARLRGAVNAVVYASKYHSGWFWEPSASRWLRPSRKELAMRVVPGIRRCSLVKALEPGPSGCKQKQTGLSGHRWDHDVVSRRCSGESLGTPSKVKLTVVLRGTTGATARRSLHLSARAAFKEKGAHEPRCLTAQAEGADLHLAPHNPCLRGSGVNREHAASSPAEPQPAACPARREIEPKSSLCFASGRSA
jgi:hypothetical protein